MKKLVVGLGNPGPDYDWTPHNVGFHVLDEIARREKVLFEPAAKLSGFHGPRNFAFADLARLGALLVKPTTYMNLSGEAVAPIVQHVGAPIENVFVVYDELDLPLGALRIRPQGGTAGHRGMESLVWKLGSDRFPRLRMGIGRPRTDAARHVLTPFAGEQRVEAEISVAHAADAVLDWLDGGDLSKTMTRFHSRWTQGPEAS